MVKINWRNKKMMLLFVMLFLVFVSLNSKVVWKIMYPIEYEDIIKTNMVHYQMDPFMVLAVIQVETRFEEDKTSKKGAIGLMQIMPETAKWIAAKAEFSNKMLKELDKPENNIMFGSWYLRQLMQQFDDNVYVAIAAYNAGPTKVDRWIREGVWDGTLENLDQIPYGETRHYVQRVFHFYERYQWIYEDEF